MGLKNGRDKDVNGSVFRLAREQDHAPTGSQLDRNNYGVSRQK